MGDNRLPPPQSKAMQLHMLFVILGRWETLGATQPSHFETMRMLSSTREPWNAFLCFWDFVFVGSSFRVSQPICLDPIRKCFFLLKIWAVTQIDLKRTQTPFDQKLRIVCSSEWFRIVFSGSEGPRASGMVPTGSPWFRLVRHVIVRTSSWS